MALEVKAACEGASNAGGKKIWVKDAHGSGRNIDHNLLPKNTRLIRGWSRHPYGMMQEINSSFDASLFIGYHSYATSPNNPLSHTKNGGLFYSVKINDMLASEFLINSYTSNLVGVPVVFLSGDYGICDDGKKLNRNLTVVSTKKGVGGSVISNHPKTVLTEIRSKVQTALENDLAKCKVDLPNSFKIEIVFKQHFSAYKNSFYPGMKMINDTTIIFETKEYFDVLRMFNYMVA